MKIKNQGKGTLYLCVNHKCNCDCLFCIDTPTNRTPGRAELSLDEIKQFIYDHYQTANFLELNGGEATIHPRIIEVMRFASSYFEGMSLSTNGLKLADYDFAEQILANGISFISIPIYATQAQLHDHMVQCEGAFKKLVQGLQNLMRLKEKYSFKLHFKMLFTKLNYQENPRIVDWLQENGFIPDKLSLNGLRTSKKVLQTREQVFLPFYQAKDELSATVEKSMYFAPTFYLHEIPLCALHKETVSRLIFVVADIYLNEKVRSLKPGETARDSDRKLLILPICQQCILFEICDKIYAENCDQFDYSNLSPFKDVAALVTK